MSDDSLRLTRSPLFRSERGELVVAIPEGGIALSMLSQPLEALGLKDPNSCARVRLEAPPGWRWSTVDAAFLAGAIQRLDCDGRQMSWHGLPADLAKLLGLARRARRAEPSQAPAPYSLIARLGSLTLACFARVKEFVDLLGAVVLFAPRLFTGKAKVRRADLIEIVAESSSRALIIVAIVNVLMGAILAFVGAVQLKTFGAGIYVANLVGIASVRELTPIITAIVLAGRTGASFAARIATMQANEEIDALTTLGVSPVEFLVLPRVVALSLLMPLVYVYGCVFALLGGLLAAIPTLDMSTTAYLAQSQQAIATSNFVLGTLKAFVFGGLVALVACHYGLRAPRSAAGVGSATTAAVVVSIIGIIALDAVFAVCANALDI
jgi:phospholipid/cholesterol/gamma-HCH transport system permease protein